MYGSSKKGAAKKGAAKKGAAKKGAPNRKKMSPAMLKRMEEMKAKKKKSAKR